MNRIAITVIGLSLQLLLASAAPGPTTGITSMYSRDALSRTLCFSDGQYGMVIQNGEVKNRCSDIAFSSYAAESFNAGIEGSKVAAFSDLGTEADLSAKHAVEETVGGGQAFASIQRRGDKLFIGRGSQQEITPTDAFFRKLHPVASIPIEVGHIYLLHIADRHDSSAEMFVKLLVVFYARGEVVTIRWQVL